MSYDIIINNGLYFDGSNQPGQLRNIGIRNGRIDTLRCGRNADSTENLDADDLGRIRCEYD